MSVVPDGIGIVVSDMARALAFYRLLGLAIPAGAESEGHVEYVAGGYRLMWDTEEIIRSFDPEWTSPTRPGRLGLAFRCESAAAVDAVYVRMTDAGYTGHKAPWDAFWGQRYAQVADPDGTVLDLFAAL